MENTSRNCPESWHLLVKTVCHTQIVVVPCARAAPFLEPIPFTCDVALAPEILEVHLPRWPTEDGAILAEVHLAVVMFSDRKRTARVSAGALTFSIIIVALLFPKYLWSPYCVQPNTGFAGVVRMHGQVHFLPFYLVKNHATLRGRQLSAFSNFSRDNFWTWFGSETCP